VEQEIKTGARCGKHSAAPQAAAACCCIDGIAHAKSTMPKPKARPKAKRPPQSRDEALVAAKRSKHVQSDSSGTSNSGGTGLTPPTQSKPAANVGQPLAGPRVFQLQTGRPLMSAASNPPSVVAVVPVAPVNNEVINDHESKTWFEACQRNGRMDNQEMLTKDISAYVRYELFPKLKFIMNSKQLSYSAERTSICGLICCAMGLLEEKAAVSWWERYKDMIADVLNAKRADVTGALKRAFLSKFICAWCAMDWY
jgi:hypothetical protein